MESKGLSGPLVIPPSLHVIALLALALTGPSEMLTFFPDLAGGKALWTLLQISTRA